MNPNYYNHSIYVHRVTGDIFITLPKKYSDYVVIYFENDSGLLFVRPMRNEEFEENYEYVGKL